MRRWGYVLGGLIVWAVHFAGVYAFVSLEAQTPAADTRLWQDASVALTLACALAGALLLISAIRRLHRRTDATAALMDQLAALGAALGLVAIAWQSLSVVLA